MRKLLELFLGIQGTIKYFRDFFSLIFIIDMPTFCDYLKAVNELSCLWIVWTCFTTKLVYICLFSN